MPRRSEEKPACVAKRGPVRKVVGIVELAARAEIKKGGRIAGVS